MPKMPNNHPAHIYNTFQEFFSDCYPDQKRLAAKIWKKHIEKHGNVPLILKCAVCSGEEHRVDIKLGKYKQSRKSRVERDEENNFVVLDEDDASLPAIKIDEKTLRDAGYSESDADFILAISNGDIDGDCIIVKDKK